MSKEIKFLIYCLERYRYLKKLSGKEVTILFAQYGIFDYIMKYFDSLHTMGDNYIVNDIDEIVDVFDYLFVKRHGWSFYKK